MEAVRIKQVLAQDGEVTITDLPYKKGQIVDVIVLRQPSRIGSGPRLTVGALRRSGLIGLWQDRDDIRDSSQYARRLREQAEQRGDRNSDPTG
jgi:hypothetical protein